jgi:hypothetical protein
MEGINQRSCQKVAMGKSKNVVYSSDHFLLDLRSRDAMDDKRDMDIETRKKRVQSLPKRTH